MLLLEHSCDIYRNSSLGTNCRRQSQLEYTAIRCLSLPMSAQASVQNGFDVGRAYDFYFDQSADVRVKDKLVCNGRTFTVAGVMPYELPTVGHLHVLAQQEFGS